jgi:hypothetical protein
MLPRVAGKALAARVAAPKPGVSKVTYNDPKTERFYWSKPTSAFEELIETRAKYDELETTVAGWCRPIEPSINVEEAKKFKEAVEEGRVSLIQKLAEQGLYDPATNDVRRQKIKEALERRRKLNAEKKRQASIQEKVQTARKTHYGLVEEPFEEGAAAMLLDSMRGRPWRTEI